LHPTVKPAAMVADAILDCSARGEIVLDGFLGSGTTAIAAERTGRRCYGLELDPVYVRVTLGAISERSRLRGDCCAGEGHVRRNRLLPRDVFERLRALRSE